MTDKLLPQCTLGSQSNPITVSSPVPLPRNKNANILNAKLKASWCLSKKQRVASWWVCHVGLPISIYSSTGNDCDQLGAILSISWFSLQSLSMKFPNRIGKNILPCCSPKARCTNATKKIDMAISLVMQKKTRWQWLPGFKTFVHKPVSDIIVGLHRALVPDIPIIFPKRYSKIWDNTKLRASKW